MVALYLDSARDQADVGALVGKYRSILFDAAALIQFGPMLVLLFSQSHVRGTADWCLGLGTAIAWLVARFAIRGDQRFLGMTLSALLLLAGTLVIAPAGAPAFVPVASLSYAIVLAGVIAYRVRWAITLIGMTSALVAAVALAAPPAALAAGDDLDTTLAILLCAIGGGGILLTKVEYVRLWRRTDLTARLAVRDRARSQRAAERQLARALAERRVHETVLNTLTAISMGVGMDRPEEIKEACRSDIEQLDVMPRPLQAFTASGAVSVAARSAEAFGVTCTITGEDHSALDTFAAWALRDAVTEALINVARHSGVLQAQLTITGGNESVVSVSDSGRGLSLSDAERLGVKKSIRDGIRDVGGSATLEAREGYGTTVTFRIPRKKISQPLPLEARDLTSTNSLFARTGLLGSLLVLLIGSPLLSRNMTQEHWLIGLSACALAINIALALMWGSRFRMPLALLSLASLALVYFSATRGNLSCSNQPSIMWILGLVGGGGALLAMLAPDSLRLRLGVIALVTAIGAVVVFQIPTSCRGLSFLPLITNGAYLMSLWLLMRWGERNFLRDREIAREARTATLARKLESERVAAAREGWATVDPVTRSFLESIASGAVNPGASSSQKSAATLSKAIRSRMSGEFDGLESQGLVESLGLLSLASTGLVEFEQLSPIVLDEPLPPQIYAAVGRIVHEADGAEVRISIAESDGTQVLVVCSTPEGINRAGLEGRALDTTDCFAETFVDSEDPDVACLVIERRFAFHGSSPA